MVKELQVAMFDHDCARASALCATLMVALVHLHNSPPPPPPFPPFPVAIHFLSLQICPLLIPFKVLPVPTLLWYCYGKLWVGYECSGGDYTWFASEIRTGSMTTSCLSTEVNTDYILKFLHMNSINWTEAICKSLANERMWLLCCKFTPCKMSPEVPSKWLA